jgi:hypothetical protein
MLFLQKVKKTMDKSAANFKKLQDEWYKKLKDEGFVDIENSVTLADGKKGYENTGRSGPNLKNKTSEQFNATLLYYQNCRSFLTHYDFNCELDKNIWSLYTEGLSYRKINEQLKNNNIKFNKDYVRKTVKRLEKIMNTDILLERLSDSKVLNVDEI